MTKYLIVKKYIDEIKTKTVTYKQLMGTKVALQNMLSRDEMYGLLKQ